MSPGQRASFIVVSSGAAGGPIIRATRKCCRCMSRSIMPKQHRAMSCFRSEPRKSEPQRRRPHPMPFPRKRGKGRRSAEQGPHSWGCDRGGAHKNAETRGAASRCGVASIGQGRRNLLRPPRAHLDPPLSTRERGGGEGWAQRLAKTMHYKEWATLPSGKLPVYRFPLRYLAPSPHSWPLSQRERGSSSLPSPSGRRVGDEGRRLCGYELPLLG